MDEIHSFAVVLVVVAGGLWLALVSTRLTAWLRVPAPVVFLLAAAAISDVFPGLSEPVSIRDVERIGVVALIAILFDGGVQVGWRRLRPQVRPIALLGIVGTFVTAALGAVAAQAILPVSWTTAAIIGAALAPTDPAVMFAVLARRDLGGRVPTILEGEAGANDPVAIALVVALTDYATTGASGIGGAADFVLEMLVGAAVGIGGAILLVRAMRSNPLPREGLYAVRTLAIAGLIYGGATLLHGSGFLAVFVAGVWIGDARMPFKGEIERFHAALGSLGEIVVFAALGLTIHLYDIGWSTAGYGLALAAVLVLVVRPVAVLPLLWPERMRPGEKAFVALTGFKGAVPILLAALAVLQHVPDAGLIYRLVFVVVAASVIAQGLALEPLAHRLGVPMSVRRRPRGWALRIPLRHEPEGVVRLVVAPAAIAAGRQIRDLPIGEGAWVALVVRGGRTEQPRGSLTLEPGDEVVLLTDPGDEAALRRVFTRPRETDAPKGV
ncbi:MAG TPA: cation:proton antiporter [Gaiellales bacterium]|jgi:cell volume regulation protein A